MVCITQEDILNDANTCCWGGWRRTGGPEIAGESRAVLTRFSGEQSDNMVYHKNMYVCVYVCTYACIYVCVCVCPSTE